MKLLYPWIKKNNKVCKQKLKSGEEDKLDNDENELSGKGILTGILSGIIEFIMNIIYAILGW